MSDDETVAALAGVLSTLAKQYDPKRANTFSGQVAANNVNLAKISLPGPNSSAKSVLERELSALASRIQFLESTASTFRGSALPLTPGTPGEPGISPPFQRTSSDSPTDRTSLPARQVLGTNRDKRSSWMNNWLAAGEGGNGDRQLQTAQLTEEQLSNIRDHLNKQTDQIKSQREHIESLSAQVQRQQRAQTEAFGNGIEDFEGLTRELQKHQQANLAFQKALREIGSIVTAVANGDLSKKVVVHAKEMDPEIATFKRTINIMVDQLGMFASQVTDLAREVGTEGKLGGQAEVPDVSGVWAELTDNGAFWGRCLDLYHCH